MNQSLYALNKIARKTDLVVSLRSEFNLTEGKVYDVQKNAEEQGGFSNSVWIINDLGRLEEYSPEYFAMYKGVNKRIQRITREVEFKGKSILSIKELDNLGIKHRNGYVSGNLIVNGETTFIVGGLVEVTDTYIVHEWYTEVIPETVGQYTGLVDKYKTKIWEHDVISHEDGEYSFIAKVVYADWGFYLEGIEPKDNFSFEDITDRCEVDGVVITENK